MRTAVLSLSYSVSLSEIHVSLRYLLRHAFIVCVQSRLHKQPDIYMSRYDYSYLLKRISFCKRLVACVARICGRKAISEICIPTKARLIEHLHDEEQPEGPVALQWLVVQVHHISSHPPKVPHPDSNCSMPAWGDYDFVPCFGFRQSMNALTLA